MTKDVKMIASLMDDTNMGEKLIDATKILVSAFSDLLKTVEPEAREVIIALETILLFTNKP